MEDNKSKSNIISRLLPGIIAELCAVITIIIDYIMVAALGTAGVSAVAVCIHPTLFITGIFSVFITAAGVLIYGCISGEKRDEANGLFITAVKTVTAASVVIGLLIVVFANQVIDFCAGQVDTHDMAVIYLKITVGCILLSNLLSLFNITLQRAGKARKVFAANLIYYIINIVLDYFLITGKCGFPELGIKGAAIATVIATAAALLFDIVILFGDSNFVSIAYIFKNKIKGSMEYLGSIMNGFKKSISDTILPRTGAFFTGVAAARMGSYEFAIYTVCDCLFEAAMAFGTAFKEAAEEFCEDLNDEEQQGNTHPDKTGGYTKKLVMYGILAAFIIGGLMILLAKPYCSLFCAEEEFLEIGFDACLFGAIATLFMVPRMALSGLVDEGYTEKKLLSAGDICTGIVQPIACVVFVLILKEGIEGAHYAMVLAQLIWLIIAVIDLVSYRNNRIKSKE
ncbi:MAG: MATE family efflux transporter [Lachnospiraceae bacterium]|nr:MATE family efflux transporter [Lachnospiraceae bacterium]